MNKYSTISSFINDRPDSFGVFGYGSGVFKQESYSDLDKPQIDLMFIVADMKDWHKKNIELNKNDYSILGKTYFNLASIKSIKGYNNISYLSNIKYKGYKFKYGVIEFDDFIRNLTIWDTFFVAGRFHKPTLNFKSNDLIDVAIENNIKYALMVGCLLSNSSTNVLSLYETICKLSYIGDARMKIAENPHKVHNIVKGSLSKFVNLYLLNEDYVIFGTDGSVFIDHNKLLNRIDELPYDLYNYITGNTVFTDDLKIVRYLTLNYFNEKNKKESISQMIEGVRTNGVVRSVPYALAKVQKRFNSK